MYLSINAMHMSGNPLLGGILRIVLEYKFMLKIEESNLKRLIQTTALEWIPLWSHLFQLSS